MHAVLRGLLEPPLDPSGDEARHELRRELVKPEYQDTDVLDRLVRWLERLVGDGVDVAAGSRPLSVAVAVLVALALVAVVLLLVSRARGAARSGTRAAAVLGAETLSADELRARAEQALAAGATDEAVVEAFRAIAVRQIERGRIEDIPQATAHELAAALAAVFGTHARAIRDSADLFDAVRYGDHPADTAQARALLALDDTLAAHRPDRFGALDDPAGAVPR
ncbi:DUF4129 domain-containing protein [Nocardioides sp. zg-536]|uniref:DUF4129 domain-containing protein n=1 Tax=Nocardioides faecalis TaxID=2803858 RepID=A0A938Y5K5_9ACTN|nr:DUF4129 domain-containing protein [Nocardioides faecalis]MBM9459637.1 DUF4129 domain-containing protein [Nocardioides faecalis]QVI58163.1 DUF4129 domain-containing protein [Nocardioides faecalis]